MTANSFNIQWIVDPSKAVMGEGFHTIFHPKAQRFYELRKAFPKAINYLRNFDADSEYVYCLHFKDGSDEHIYKFGKSRDVLSRIRTLQTGCPYRLELIFLTNFFEEKYFHEWLSTYRRDGEWFKIPLDPDSLTFSFEDFLLFDANISRQEQATLIDQIRNKCYEWGIEAGQSPIILEGELEI